MLRGWQGHEIGVGRATAVCRRADGVGGLSANMLHVGYAGATDNMLLRHDNT